MAKISHKHEFGAQTIPINRQRVVCLRCGTVRPINKPKTGRRSKCSPTRRLVHLKDSGVGSLSTATGILKPHLAAIRNIATKGMADD